MLENLNANNEKLIVVEIDLIEKYPIKLKVVYYQSNQKKYLLREAIVVKDTILTDKQVEMKELKVFMNKFIMNKLNISHKNKYLKSCQKKKRDNNEEYVLNTLKVHNYDIYLDDIDIQVLLNMWNDSLLGFSRIMLYTQNKLIVASKNTILFNGSKYLSDVQNHMTSLINPDPLFLETIQKELLTGNMNPDELDKKLKILKAK